MNNRKILALALVFVMAAGVLAGCGSQPAAPAGGDTILIGVNFELSGSLAGYGESKLNGVKIALEEINAAGGVLGKQIVLQEYDNKGDDAEAVSISTRLMSEDKVVAMMGPVTSGRVLASVNVAKQFQVPMVTGSGTSAKITVNDDGSINDFVYRICFTDPYQGTLAANYAVDTLGLTTAATLVNQSDEYSILMAEAFTKTFVEKGGTITEESTFMQGDLDFMTALTRIVATNAEMIFVPNYYEPDALIAKQAQELGYDGYLLGGDGWDNLDHVVGTAGAAALQKAVFINHYFPGEASEKNQAFVQKYTELHDGTPPSFAALGYDLMYFVADAITRAGAADPIEINTAIAATTEFEGITGTFAMGENHDPIKYAMVIGYDAEGKYELKGQVQ